ncbi:hypothetical protein [Halorarius halobius]|uniref:hypothetical protein n=1 Tax=Halorarius halobius TaxID=2962671 RepID=UPI0020CB6FB3|nr:hypothetical protein [Halorarius halobius]
MRRVSVVAALLTLLVASVAAPLAGARPPRSETDDNGLTENESATLWSRDDDSYVTSAEYREAYDDNRTALEQVANGTDLTFKRPPSTAARWTRADHEEFPSGNESTSLYPPHANLTDGRFVRDAHATIFAVTPSTTAHVAPNETAVYAAPTGTVRGVVDYRVLTAGQLPGINASISSGAVTHDIDEVRLRRDGEVIARGNGTCRPELDYRLVQGREQLQLAADIRVTVTTPTTTISETVTVMDTVTVRTHDLQVDVRTARYPDGDLGIAVYRNGPWQGIRLSETGSRRVRGVWRFYTARDPRWDQLVKSTATNDSRVTSPILPVGVHAYPSRFGPRVEPTGNGPEFVEVWGIDHRSPAATLPENVTVDVVEDTYRTSFGMAVRTRVNDTESIRVPGIVRGVNASLASITERRTISESRLEVRRLGQTNDRARFLLELTAADTGEPITLQRTDNPRYAPIVPGRNGYIRFAGERIRTNASGLATVTVTESGVYTARYVPGSWLTHDPAYTTAAATVRWHPLGTIAGWLELLTTGITWFLPFAVALYAGRKLGDIFAPRTRYP